jgi:transcriptional regulator with XRE-family HTH domain
MKVMEPLPTRLREVRHAAGLNLEDLALLSGVSPSALSRAERGLCELSPDARVRVSKALRLRYSAARQVVELAP